MRKYDTIYENVQCACPGIPPPRTHPAEMVAQEHADAGTDAGTFILNGALLSTRRAPEVKNDSTATVWNTRQL